MSNYCDICDNELERDMTFIHIRKFNFEVCRKYEESVVHVITNLRRGFE